MIYPPSPTPAYKVPLPAQAHPEQLRGDPDFMQTLARGLHVIRAFGERRQPQTAAELARRAGLSRAVTQRCLYTLVALGYAEQHDRHYVLTPLILSLGHAYFASTPFVSLAQPVLEELSAAVDETCALAIMEGNEMMYLARSEVHRILATSLGLGSRLPAYCTAIGRIMLAQLTPVQLARYLEEVELKPYTEYTVVQRARLCAELEQVQRQDYAIGDQELELNVCAIGVPVRSASGKVVSAINVSLKTSRPQLDRLTHEILPAARAAADKIGRFLVL